MSRIAQGSIWMVLALCLLLSLACGAQVRTVSETRDFALREGQFVSIPVDLKKGDQLELSVTVRRGGNLDIGVRVEGPAGWELVPFQRVQHREFTVTANADGRYVIILDNTYSLFTDKLVTLVVKYPRRL